MTSRTELSSLICNAFDRRFKTGVNNDGPECFCTENWAFAEFATAIFGDILEYILDEQMSPDAAIEKAFRDDVEEEYEMAISSSTE